MSTAIMSTGHLFADFNILKASGLPPIVHIVCRNQENVLDHL
jgi:hypothetical protein